MKLPLNLPDARNRPFDVVGCGLNMMDLLIMVRGHPEPNTKQGLEYYEYCVGGQVATAMVACSRLGWRTRYVGAFGDDDNGKIARKSLEAEGIDLGSCQISTATPNGFSVILVDNKNGDRTVLWSRDSNLRLDPKHIDRQTICSGRVLLVDCHDTAASTVAARYARAAGNRTVIDVERVRPGIGKLLSEIDIIITAQDFPTELTGIVDEGAALRALRDAYQPSVACLTLGAEGSLAIVGDTEIRTPGFKVPVVDSTGAGDVFRAGFISGWLRAGASAEVDEVLLYANAVAGLNCRGFGGRTAIPNARDVDELLRLR